MTMSSLKEQTICLNFVRITILFYSKYETIKTNIFLPSGWCSMDKKISWEIDEHMMKWSLYS